MASASKGWSTKAAATTIATALRSALLAPATAPELSALKKKLEALAHFPLPIPASSSPDAIGAVAEVARCEAAPFAATAADEISPSRRSKLGDARRSVKGGSRSRSSEMATPQASLRMLCLPERNGRRPLALESAPPQTSDEGAAIVEASPGVSAGSARVTIAFRSAHAASQRQQHRSWRIRRARSHHDSRRSAARESPAQIKDVTATAHPFGGCLSLTLDVGRRAIFGRRGRRGWSRRRGGSRSLAKKFRCCSLRRMRGLHMKARAPETHAKPPRSQLGGRSFVTTCPKAIASPSSCELHQRVKRKSARTPFRSIRCAQKCIGSRKNGSEITHRRIERVKVERGQDELWVLLASPCGVTAERSADAGISATFLTRRAASIGGPRIGSDVTLEPWFSADGVGLVAHGRRTRRRRSDRTRTTNCRCRRTLFCRRADRLRDVVGCTRIAVSSTPKAQTHASWRRSRMAFIRTIPRGSMHAAPPTRLRDLRTAPCSRAPTICAAAPLSRRHHRQQK